MILEKSPASLRGELSRWLVPIRPGVYVGSPSKRVRDELWTKACKKIKEGGVTQVWTAPNEQGFTYRQHGTRDQQMLDYDGLGLITRYARPPGRAKGVAESTKPG
jgi:CRISPR-associated protein Cas2